MKKAFFLFLAAAMLLCGCDKECSVSETLFVFDTVLTVTLYGESGTQLEEAIDGIKIITDSINKCASAHNPDSELSRLNSSAYNCDIAVSETLYEIIKTGLYYSELTDGTLDITLGYLTEKWAIGTERFSVPDEEYIGKYKELDGYRAVLTDDENRTVRFSDDKIRLDLGGIAKGFAAEKCDEYLRYLGIDKALLDFGGNIVAVGRKSEDSQWKIGIKNPLDNGIFAAVSCENKSVVTSGNYERYSTLDGVRYHHILDGKTGYPSDSGVISATIIAENSAEADCLSTAVFVLGAEKGKSLIESIDGAEAVIIDENLNVTATSGITDDILEIL